MKKICVCQRLHVLVTSLKTIYGTDELECSFKYMLLLLSYIALIMFSLHMNGDISHVCIYADTISFWTNSKSWNGFRYSPWNWQSLLPEHLVSIHLCMWGISCLTFTCICLFNIIFIDISKSSLQNRFKVNSEREKEHVIYSTTYSAWISIWHFIYTA